VIIRSRWRIFRSTLVNLNAEAIASETSTALILFCLHGTATIHTGADKLILSAGESCFVPAAVVSFAVSGEGQLVQIGSR
jgi:Phosphomannose isomerase